MLILLNIVLKGYLNILPKATPIIIFINNMSWIFSNKGVTQRTFQLPELIQCLLSLHGAVGNAPFKNE